MAIEKMTTIWAERRVPARAAQARVHDEGGDDEIRRRIVEAVGELAQRQRQGHAHAHTIGQEGQVLADDWGGGVGGRGDRLL